MPVMSAMSEDEQCRLRIDGLRYEIELAYERIRRIEEKIHNLQERCPHANSKVDGLNRPECITCGKNLLWEKYKRGCREEPRWT